MLSQKQAEEAIVSNYNEVEQEGGSKEEGAEREVEEDQSLFSVKNFLWHGGSAWDAWFSCASNQVINFLFSFPPILKPNNNVRIIFHSSLISHVGFFPRWRKFC